MIGTNFTLEVESIFPIGTDDKNIESDLTFEMVCTSNEDIIINFESGSHIRIFVKK